MINLIQIEKGEEIKSIITMEDYTQKNLLFVTQNGVVKKTQAKEFERINRNGKKAIKLKDEDHLIGVTAIPSNEPTEVIIGNSNGKAIRFHDTDVREMGRTASGVRGISIDDGYVVDYASSSRGHLILSISENGFGKLTELENYRITKRGGKGVISINVSKAGKLLILTAVVGNEDVMIVTDKGTVIRTNLSKVSKVSRNSKGVTIVKLKENEKITSATIVKSSEEIEEEIIDITKETFIEIPKENTPTEEK